MITCGNCGSPNEDSATRCTNCGHSIENVAAQQGSAPTPYTGGPPPYQPPQYGAPPYYGAPVHVPNYLAQAIIVTLFCCLPTGVPAIIYAAQANGKQSAGDIPGAMESASKAKTWCWVSFGIGIAWIVLWFVFVILGTATSVSTTTP